MPFAVVITALVLGGLGLLLALNTAAAANELRRHTIATRDEAIAAQVDQLRNEIAASAAPGNLASAAVALGMVPAVNPAFIVDVHGRLLVRGKPAPVPWPVVPVKHTPAATTPAKKTPTPAKSPKTSTPATDSTKAPHGKSTSTSTAPKSRGATSAAPTTSAAPSPTPTPTVTLPGGPR
jgi:hypothetical protein